MCCQKQSSVGPTQYDLAGRRHQTAGQASRRTTLAPLATDPSVYTSTCLSSAERLAVVSLSRPAEGKRLG